MKNIINISLVVASTLLIGGCDLFKSSSSTKVAAAINYENNLTVTKKFKILEGSSNITLNFSSNLLYIKKISGLDSELFSVNGNSVKLDITPIYNNPQDENKDNIYEVKLYSVDTKNNDFITYVKLEVLSSDNNTTGGDNNNTSGGDNNNTGDGDNNNTVVITDANNNNIPDDIEAMLQVDSDNDGIIDPIKGDEFFDKQWYIKAKGIATNPSEVASIEGNDLNLFEVYKSYMGYNKGNPIILQIVDSGVDIEHEDLKDNIDLSRSLNNNKQGNPTPGGYYKPHGTMLAGIAAARAFNGKGVRGVAPFAKIAGSNWLVDQSLDGLNAAWFSGNGANEIAVTNNSWGRYYTIDTFYEDIMEEGSKTLRDGKGRVYVFASGNARGFNADANIQYVINNQYAIVVGALNYKNEVASYSTPGANIWITAYGGAANFDTGPTIATTYLSGQSTHTWDSDISKNYTYAMAGSSAAAPMVTGAIGLILEACPNLRWRDVKYILAKTAKKVDTQSSSWITNNSGLHFSRDYGFGLIDTKAAIDMCKNNYVNLGNQFILTSKISLSGVQINGSREISIGVKENKKIEWVEATIDLDTQNASDYDIYLTSPGGTKVLLLKHGTMIDPNFIPNSDWMKGGFRFGTSAFLDENSIGEWKLEIVDTKTNTATLKSAELKIYGH